jgi:peptidoglycan L-alanyl-D-glutamate endopeptidase CwlK
MTYKLGNRSKERLEGVDERLQAVVRSAIGQSSQDFTVLEGLRSIERQRELVARGASKTMKSKHIDGLAVDVGAYDSVTGIRWEEELYFAIAEAMRSAAKDIGVPLCWGAAWAVEGHPYPYDCTKWEGSMRECWEAYHNLRRSQGRVGFNDMPHFEIIE